MVTATGAPLCFDWRSRPSIRGGMKGWRKANGLRGLIVQGHEKHIVCHQRKCEGCSKSRWSQARYATACSLPLAGEGTRESRATRFGKAMAPATSPDDAGVAR